MNKKSVPLSVAWLAIVSFTHVFESAAFTVISTSGSTTTQTSAWHNTFDARITRRYTRLDQGWPLRSSSVGNRGESARRTGNTSRNTQGENENLVVYQKIVQPPPSTVDIAFLGSLVSFLQDHWDVPERLPMVYHKQIPDTDESGLSDNDHAVVILESPLSSSPDATTLKVEVVAIYPRQNGNEESICSMAMVVVKKHAKAKQLFGVLPPMMQNLFADSERQIVRALDRGLEDFSAGQISQPNIQRDKGAPEVKKAEADWIGELMDDDDLEIQPPPPRNMANVVDAEVVTDKPEDEQDSKRDIEISSNKGDDGKTSASFETAPSDVPSSNDFAVEAARKAAMKQKEEGFAVIAARKAAAQRSKSSQKVKMSEKEPTQSNIDRPLSSSETSLADDVQDDQDPDQVDLTNLRPPSLGKDVMGNRAFHQTFSLPRKVKSVQKKMKSEQSPKTKDREEGLRTKKGLQGAKQQKPQKQQPTSERKTKAEVLSKEKATKRSNRSESDRLAESEAVNSVKDALEEMAEKSSDITPEQLLDDVMKFGDASDKQERVGDGFTTGAFEKAKELLREQHRQRDERLRSQKLETKEADKMMNLAPDIKIPEPEGTQSMSPEEELKKMFEAGEQLADGRIQKWESSGSSLSQGTDAVTEEQVDALIAAEKEISSYARVLDDELVELELRLNKSPGEELDGPPRNPQFDIMSGPEVYNPNVDPETAVNWPGALPGTKNTRLPKELQEAVVQAKFAAETLSNLKVIERADGSKKFYVGEREITMAQVEKMKKVVADGVEVGLIADPIVLMAERSRLQMVLDELWNQPEERTREIVMNYKDLMLSDNFVELIRERLSIMVERDLDALRNDDTSMEEKHTKERQLLGQLVVHAQLLLKEARALGAELEAQQLEVVRSICKVAMDPIYKTEEETAMALTDAVRDMRPLFDDAFVAYLKYAVEEEEGRLARAGVVDDPEHNRWLYVLKIVQNGVYEELSRGINRYIDHIGYVLRMETPVERKMLLEKLIDVMPTLDVRPFVAVVENIVGALGDGARGEFQDVTVLGEMSNKILQLHKDVKDLLPPERIAEKARDADEWAAKKKQKLLQQRQETQKRLEAARETEEFDEAVDVLGRSGEVERFDGI